MTRMQNLKRKFDSRMVQHMLLNLGQKNMVLSTPVTQMHPSAINQNCQIKVWTGTGWAGCRDADINCPTCEHEQNTMESDAERHGSFITTQSAAHGQATQGQDPLDQKWQAWNTQGQQFTGEQK